MANMRRKQPQMDDDSDSGDESPMSGTPHYFSSMASYPSPSAGGGSSRTIHVLQHGNTVYQNLVPPVDPVTGKRPNVSIEQEGNHIYQNFSPQSDHSEETVFQAMASHGVMQQQQQQPSTSHSASGASAGHTASGGAVNPVYQNFGSQPHCSGSLHHHGHSHGANVFMSRQASGHSSATFHQPGSFLVQNLGGPTSLFHQAMQFGSGGGHQQLSHFGPAIVPPCSNSSSGSGFGGPTIVPPCSGSSGSGFGLLGSAPTHHGGNPPRRFHPTLGPPPQYPGSGAAPANPAITTTAPAGAAGKFNLFFVLFFFTNQ